MLTCEHHCDAEGHNRPESAVLALWDRKYAERQARGCDAVEDLQSCFM